MQKLIDTKLKNIDPDNEINLSDSDKDVKDRD